MPNTPLWSGWVSAAMGLGGEDFDYAVTERALDADAGDVNDGDEAAIPPEVLAGFSAMLGVFIDTVISPEGRGPHPQAIGVRVLPSCSWWGPRRWRANR